MHTLHYTGRLRLEGEPALWSKSTMVLSRILMGLITLVAVGAFIAVVAVGIFVENPPWGGMVFGFIGCLGMMTILFLWIRHTVRRRSRYQDTERQPVVFEPQGLTMRGVGPIPWVDFGPAERRMVPAEHDDGFTLRAVMELTPSGMFNVNERTPPEMRELISPAMGPIWNRHHRYIYVPGVDGFRQAEVIELINMAHRMFWHANATPPYPPQ